MTVNKKVTVLHFNRITQPAEAEILTLFGNPIEISHIYHNLNGDITSLEKLIQEASDQSDAIALSGISSRLRYGSRSATFEPVHSLLAKFHPTSICDGAMLQPALERWGVRSAHTIEPGIWSNKRILFMPQLNHTGMMETLSHYSTQIKSTDATLLFDEKMAQKNSLQTSLLGNLPYSIDDKELIERLSSQSLEDLFGSNSTENVEQITRSIKADVEWADVIAGDSRLIADYGTQSLTGKTVLVPFITPEDVSKLRGRGVEIIVTVLPNLSHDISSLARHSCSVIEACLAVSSDPKVTLDENHFLNLLSELTWKPTILYLQPENFEVNRFGYITQPNSISDIRDKIALTRFVPKAVLDRTAVHIPPVFHGRVENIIAEGNQHSAISEVITLGGTPDEFTAQGTDLVERRVFRATSMAEQLDARLIGADTASREINNALSAVAEKTNIAVCSGQALTIYSVLEQGVNIAKANSIKNEGGLIATVLNAGDPIITVAAEVLAGMVPSLTLFGSDPDLLISLKRSIEDIHTKVTVKIGTDPDDMVLESDLILLGRSPNNKRMSINLELFRPGAVICDLSQPSAIAPANLAKRPDLTLIESGTFKLAEPTVGKPSGHLPMDIITASFAEAALLAIKGKFSDFGLAGQLNSGHVYKIRDLALKCGFKLDGIVAHGQLVPKGTIENRKALAQQLDQQLKATPHINPSQYPSQYNEAVLAQHPDRPSIRRYAREHSSILMAGFGLLAFAAGVAGWFFRSKRNSED